MSCLQCISSLFCLSSLSYTPTHSVFHMHLRGWHLHTCRSEDYFLSTMVSTAKLSCLTLCKHLNELKGTYRLLSHLFQPKCGLLSFSCILIHISCSTYKAFSRAQASVFLFKTSADTYGLFLSNLWYVDTYMDMRTSKHRRSWVKSVLHLIFMADNYHHNRVGLWIIRVFKFHGSY